MTKEQKLKKLKEAIISAVPEIIELKFGCEIYIEGCDYVFTFVAKENENYILKTEEGGYTIIPAPGYIKILGRPITLEDVLIVLPEKLYVNSKTGKFGHFHNHDHFNPPVYWKLNKPLDQQSKETIDFLYNLICKNGKNNH